MPIQKFRSSPEAPDFDDAGSLSYDQAPDYDQAAIDPDYDEGSQDEFADDFRDSDAQEPSQEWYARKQK